MPRGVTDIGARAFAGSSLTRIELPNTVSSIGPDAFAGCNALTAFVEAGSYAESYVIEHGIAYESYSIPLFIVDENGMLTGYEGAISGHVVIPEEVNGIKVKAIGNYAFGGCSSLTSVNIPSGVTSIGDRVFSSCSSLTSIDIPSSVTSIGVVAFYNCNKLTSINIPADSRLTCIEASAFKGCSRLKSIAIPSSVTYIGENAFADCFQLIAYITGKSYTYQYCIDNSIPYRLYSAFRVRISQSWVRSNGSLYAFVSANPSGGAAPYEYRFTVMPSGGSAITTSWSMSPSVCLELPECETFTAQAEVRDSLGLIACSALVESATTDEAEDDDEEEKPTKLGQQFLELINAAPEPQSLNGVKFNESTPEGQWLINIAVQVLHLDLSVFQTPVNKQAFLFETAFKAAANGNEMILANVNSLPDVLKPLTKGIAAAEEDYFKALYEITKDTRYKNFGYVCRENEEMFKDLLKSFTKGDVTEMELLSKLKIYGVADDALERTAGVFRMLKGFSVVTNVVKYGGMAYNAYKDFVKIYNLAAMIEAIDTDVLLDIMALYEDTDDPAYQYVAERLRDICNTVSFEDKVKLVAGGQLAGVTVDGLLDLVPLADGHPVAQFLFAAVDLITGSGDYAKTYNELMWACDALQGAWESFVSRRAYFSNNPRSSLAFEDALTAYIYYLQTAAKVEESYVQLCEMQKGIVITDTPDYVLEMADTSEKRATALHSLAAEVINAKHAFDDGMPSAATIWFRNCVDDQERIKSNIFDDDSSGESGGHGR